MVIVVYVDDLILVTNSEKQRTAFKDTVATRFKMRDLGPVAQLLGIKIERTKDTLKPSQPHFIKKLLEATRMTNCKTKPVPLPESMVANLHKDEESEETKYPYRKVLGSLIFLSNATRPDLSYSVSILGRYGQRPTEMHTRAIKHVLRYLAHTPDLGITYYRNNREPMFGASDANHKREPLARSRSGICLFRGGACVCWRSFVERTPTDNTAEAEYRAAVDCAKLVMWARELLKELHWHDATATVIQIDNNSAVYMSLDLGSQKRTAHILVKDQWINFYHEEGHVLPHHVFGVDNPADALTKPLPEKEFTKHRATLLGKPDSKQLSLSKPIRA